jgi:hypothetical protein
MGSSNLNRSRYAPNDDTLYVAPEDERTDYVCCKCHKALPINSDILMTVSTANGQLVQRSTKVSINKLLDIILTNYCGVLISTGKRRYGHPALNGVLPEPWLPLKKGQTLVNNRAKATNAAKDAHQAVVLTLRNRYSMVRRESRRDSVPENGIRSIEPTGNPWEDAPGLSHHPPRTAPVRLNHRLSFDGASGVIVLPDDGDWLIEDVDSDEDYGVESDLGNAGGNDVPDEGSSQASNLAPLSPSKRRYGTYYHHPERRRQTVPGAFPQS